MAPRFRNGLPAHPFGRRQAPPFQNHEPLLWVGAELASARVGVKLKMCLAPVPRPRRSVPVAFPPLPGARRSIRIANPPPPKPRGAGKRPSPPLPNARFAVQAIVRRGPTTLSMCKGAVGGALTVFGSVRLAILPRGSGSFGREIASGAFGRPFFLAKSRPEGSGGELWRKTRVWRVENASCGGKVAFRRWLLDVRNRVREFREGRWGVCLARLHLVLVVH